MIWSGPKIISIFDTSIAGKLFSDASIGQDDLVYSCLRCLVTTARSPQLEQAISYLHSAVDFYPANSQAYYALSKIYYIMGNSQDAEKAITEYIHLKPQNPLGRIMLAVIKSAQCDIKVPQIGQDTAISILEQICPDPQIRNQVLDELRIGGVKGDDLMQIAVRLKNRGKLSDSLNEFAWSLALDPNSAQAWYGLGSVYQELSNWQLAIFAFTQSSKDNPGDVQAYYRIGEIMFYQQNRLDEAYQQYKKIAEINPQDFMAYIFMGNIDEKQNKVDKASNLYKIAVEISHSEYESAKNDKSKSDYIHSMFTLGDFYMRQGAYSEAKTLFEEIIQIDLQNEEKTEAYWNLGRLLLQTNNYNEAKSNFKQAFTIASGSYLRSQILYGMAQADIGLGSVDDGIKELEEAHLVDPSNEGLQRIYADTLRQNGQPARALEVYQDYLAKWPGNQDVIRAVEELRKSLNGK